MIKGLFISLFPLARSRRRTQTTPLTLSTTPSWKNCPLWPGWPWHGRLGTRPGTSSSPTTSSERLAANATQVSTDSLQSLILLTLRLHVSCSRETGIIQSIYNNSLCNHTIILNPNTLALILLQRHQRYTSCLLNFNWTVRLVSHTCWPQAVFSLPCSETPLDCEVSRWSSWGLCLEKCGRPGIRHRTRYILLQPANSGTACPDLEEGETCSSENCIWALARTTLGGGDHYRQTHLAFRTIQHSPSTPQSKQILLLWYVNSELT